MAMQTAEKHLIQRSRLPSHSAPTNKTALFAVATCLVAALPTLCLLGQTGSDPGGSHARADDNAAWVIGS